MSSTPPPVYDRVIHTGRGRYVQSLRWMNDDCSASITDDIQQARVFTDKVELDIALAALLAFTPQPQIVLRLVRPSLSPTPGGK